MPEVAGRGRCWLRSPWGAGRAGLQEGWRCCWCTGARRPWHWGRVSCHARGTVCASPSPLMSGKERSVRAPLCSPPLREGDAPTQHCSFRSRAMCHAPKKLFSSWPGTAASQDRRLSCCWHPQTHTALWHDCLCAGVWAGTATRTFCRDARGPAISVWLQTHIQGVHLFHLTGASASKQDLADICCSSACTGVPGTGAHWCAASLSH